MASRRDLIESHQFAARRVISAVVMRQTDPTEWPFRRLGGSGFGAIMIAVIAVAAVGVWGLIFPGGKTSWKDGQSVIVEKETGARYVYLKGRLHPVLNFTSAALLVGSTQVTSVGHASLARTPRGVELGIPGAPDAVPGPTNVVSPPWSLCTEPALDRSGKKIVRTALTVGRRAVAGHATGDEALLVDDTGDGKEYVVWHDRRYLVSDRDVVDMGLGLVNETAVRAGDAWVKALPAGLPIGPAHVTARGKASSAGIGGHAGDVVVIRTADRRRQYYLVEVAELRPISELQAQIELARPGARAVRELSPADGATARMAAPPARQPEQPPASRPYFFRPDSADMTVCAVYGDDSFAPKVLVHSTVPSGGGTPTDGLAAGPVPLANRVWVPPGRAALVASMSSPTVTHPPLYLVTDTGKRFAVPDDDVLHALGYGSVTPSKLPASLVVRIPEGPALDASVARQAMAQEDQDPDGDN